MPICPMVDSGSLLILGRPPSRCSLHRTATLANELLQLVLIQFPLSPPCSAGMHP
eukprot:COSAG06_NODE_40694_length_399_cov_1.320000_1_plen_54_part_01